MVDPDFKTMIETIRDHNEITEVIGSYVQLKHVGTAWKACCPFHKEKTPSFHVNPTRQSFHCFGCGAGGDVFNFMMRYESLDFMEAARRLAERANLPFTFARDGKTAEPASGKEALLKLHHELMQWYQRCLRESGQAAKARDYLKERQLDEAAIEKFGIGYAPARDMKWEAWAGKRGFEMDLLIKAGVLIRKDEGGWYDRFSDRLMFPICDDSGRVIGFSGRILPGDPRNAKYVNSPETPLFTKSKVIYALHHAKREILDKKEAIICEGQIDVIRCHLAGITNAVAAQGTAITDQHARILKRFTDTVRLVLDSDDAGQNAALRSGDTLVASGLQVRVASLPPGDDPDSMIQRDGADAFMRQIDNAALFLEFKMDILLKREPRQDDAAIMRTARAALESIALVPSEVQRDQWIKRASARLGIRPDILAAELRSTAKKTPRSSAEEDESTSPPAESATTHPREELEVVRLLIRHPHGAEWLRTYLSPRHFNSEVCRELFTLLIEHAYAEHFDLMAELSSSSAETRRVAAMLIAENKFSGTEFEAEKIAQDLIISLYRRAFEQQRREKEAKRRTATGDEAKSIEMDIMELTLNQHTLRSGWAKAKPMLDILISMAE
jgi:DNA primase